MRTVCDYVHLNPLRPHLLKAGQQLLEHPWSSFDWYLAARERRPGWLRVHRLLGDHHSGEMKRERAQAKAERLIGEDLKG